MMSGKNMKKSGSFCGFRYWSILESLEICVHSKEASARKRDSKDGLSKREKKESYRLFQFVERLCMEYDMV